MSVILTPPVVADLDALLDVELCNSKRSFQLGARWYDRLHFERHAGAVN